ncbi:MAG: N-acetylmuramic acid 6-phosphate etherase [Vampirovibrionales bacterium]|nr:N-acetylmuramic acid 6-phosphate etherase [Vampirovibrionales bacterium]
MTSTPPTEATLSASANIDLMATEAVLRLMNHADQAVPQAMRAALPAIARVVDGVVASLTAGGRLFYVGAGTSGRLAVLDAAECPPTFSAPPDLVQAIIAGGDAALRSAVEGAEDNFEQGCLDLQTAGARTGDVVIGVSASGGAPYVLGAMAEARRVGAYVAALVGVADSALTQAADEAIVIETGPEVIAGSTRLKAGTAQKLALNMISTATMIQLGKTYGNRMIDVRASNRKLRARALSLVRELAAVSESQASALLEACDWEVKTAVLAARLRLAPEQARARLAAVGGKLRLALEAPAP